MSENPIAEVSGFGVALDRAYDPAGHFWVSAGGAVARVGMDALGVETSGTIAQLAFLPIGEDLKRGEAFGSLEAGKFVGPLASPLSGTVTSMPSSDSQVEPLRSLSEMIGVTSAGNGHCTPMAGSFHNNVRSLPGSFGRQRGSTG